MNILAVVVTYNRVDLLKECLSGLLNQKYREFDILIINNNSTDNTEEYCRTIINERIFYHNTGSNIGGAGGFALGLEYALTHNYDWCWVMDDDTIALEDSLYSLIDKIKKCKKEPSFMASVVRWTDKSTCVMNRQAVATDWLGEDEDITNHIIKVAFTSFVSTMINLKIAKEVGLPISEMFIYGDDLEYTIRLSACAPGYIDIDSTVIHKMEKNISTDIISAPIERIERFYYHYRNRLYIDRKYKKAGRNIFNCSKQIIKVMLSTSPMKLKRIKIICKGVMDGLRFNPVIVSDYHWKE